MFDSEDEYDPGGAGKGNCANCRGHGYWYLDTLTGEICFLDENFDSWIESRVDEDCVGIIYCQLCGGSGFTQERAQKRLI